MITPETGLKFGAFSYIPQYSQRKSHDHLSHVMWYGRVHTTSGVGSLARDLREELGVPLPDPLAEPPLPLELVIDVTSRGVTPWLVSEPLRDEVEDGGDVGSWELIRTLFSALLFPMFGPEGDIRVLLHSFMNIERDLYYLLRDFYRQGSLIVSEFALSIYWSRDYISNETSELIHTTLPAFTPDGAGDTREDPKNGSSCILSGISSTWDNLNPFSFCKLSLPCFRRVLAAKHLMWSSNWNLNRRECNCFMWRHIYSFSWKSIVEILLNCLCANY